MSGRAPPALGETSPPGGLPATHPRARIGSAGCPGADAAGLPMPLASLLNGRLRPGAGRGLSEIDGSGVARLTFADAGMSS